jgi:hypothetical protein
LLANSLFHSSNIPILTSSAHARENPRIYDASQESIPALPAREAGATGVTVITSARGGGLVPKRTFPGLDLAERRDVVVLVVEDHLSARIMEKAGTACCFDTESGSGIAILLPVEETMGLGAQIKEIPQREKNQS